MFFKTPSASFAAPHASADLSATTADDNDTCALIPFPLLILKIKPCAISLTFFRKTKTEQMSLWLYVKIWQGWKWPWFIIFNAELNNVIFHYFQRTTQSHFRLLTQCVQLCVAGKLTAPLPRICRRFTSLTETNEKHSDQSASVKHITVWHDS